MNYGIWYFFVFHSTCLNFILYIKTQEWLSQHFLDSYSAVFDLKKLQNFSINYTYSEKKRKKNSPHTYPIPHLFNLWFHKLKAKLGPYI